MPGFPVWAAVQAPIKNHDYLQDAWPQIRSRCRARRCSSFATPRASTPSFVSIGISERSPVSVGCLWNSNLLIGADGTILNHHRKLVPTFYEKLIWANGDGAGLRVSATPRSARSAC